MTSPASSASKNAKPAKRWFLRLPVILLLVGIGVGQVLLALVFLRSVPENETHAEAAHGDQAAAAEPHDAGHGDAGHGEAPPHAPVAADPHDAHDPHAIEAEVDLGNFALTIPPTKEHPTLLVTFHVYGTIDEHHAHEFEERHGLYRHRVRQEVLTIVRQSDLKTLGDPDFGTLKKQMLERINRILQPAHLSNLVFSDFAILEH